MYVKIRKIMVQFQAEAIGALLQQDGTGSGAHKISCSMGLGVGALLLV
jgi:hypothetical protein